MVPKLSPTSSYRVTGLTALQLTVYVPLLDDEGTLNTGVGGVVGGILTVIDLVALQLDGLFFEFNARTWNE
jgi:hypothetical protein